MIQIDTERPLSVNETTPKILAQEFSKSKLFFFFPQKIYLTITNFVIYLYKSKEHFSSQPNQPLKYFNMSTLEAQIKSGDCLSLKDCQFEENLSHENSQKIKQLMDVIEHNRRLITMERMFPRRFEQLDQRITEKKEEGMKN